MKKVIQQLTQLQKALYGKNEQKIIRALKLNDSLTVTQIYKRLRMEQSEASHALANLRRYHIVDRKKVGKYRVYSLNQDRLDLAVEANEEIEITINDIIAVVSDPTMAPNTVSKLQLAS